MSDFSNFPETLRVIADGCDNSLHRGVQIYVSRGGTPLLNAAYGEALPGRPMTVKTVNLWLSAGKPLTAALVGLFCQRGLCHWEDPVSRFLTEWRGTDREEIRISQLLMHTAGLTEVETGWPTAGWTQSVAAGLSAPRISGWNDETQAAYSVGVAWFLLGELIERIAEKPFDRVLRSELLEPLGMNQTWCGMQPEEYAAIESRLGGTWTRGRAGLEDLQWHLPERCLPAAPGGNSRGPISELGSFYESLLGFVRDSPVSAETAAALTARRRTGRFDETFRHKIDWGLGLIVNSQRYGEETVPYGFGPFASDATFGHGGSQSAIGFADPHHQLVVAWVANGRIGEPKHHKRNRELNTAIYRDLGLDG